jgi:hypothetical protein
VGGGLDVEAEVVKIRPDSQIRTTTAIKQDKASRAVSQVTLIGPRIMAIQSTAHGAAAGNEEALSPSGWNLR